MSKGWPAPETTPEPQTFGSYRREQLGDAPPPLPDAPTIIHLFAETMKRGAIRLYLDYIAAIDAEILEYREVDHDQIANLRAWRELYARHIEIFGRIMDGGGS